MANRSVTGLPSGPSTVTGSDRPDSSKRSWASDSVPGAGSIGSRTLKLSGTTMEGDVRRNPFLPRPFIFSTPTARTYPDSSARAAIIPGPGKAAKWNAPSPPTK